MSEQGFTVNDYEHFEEAQRQSAVEYGIYDTRDDCWLGDESGPKLFTFADSKKANGMPTNILAQIAAQMAEVQLGYGAGRLQARQFNLTEVRLRDEVPVKMTAHEALVMVENGENGDDSDREIVIRPEDLQ